MRLNRIRYVSMHHCEREEQPATLVDKILGTVQRQESYFISVYKDNKGEVGLIQATSPNVDRYSWQWQTLGVPFLSLLIRVVTVCVDVDKGFASATRHLGYCTVSKTLGISEVPTAFP